MCDTSKRPEKPNEKQLVELFVKHLASHGNPGLKVDSWPDEESRETPDIDAIAGVFAIEHTSVDTIPNQRRDAAWLLQSVGSLEEEFRCKLPFRLFLSLSYEGIQKGQEWSKIEAALRLWILERSSKLAKGSHSIRNVPDIPFEFRATKMRSGRPGLVLARFAPEDKSLPDRLKEQLDRKTEKLAPYKNKGKTTILLVESDDIALMDEAIMWDNIRSAYPDGLPLGIDQIWLAHTSIPEDILFYDLTTAITR